jgi:peptidoglycan hydrolase CwlO-like protein
MTIVLSIAVVIVALSMVGVISTNSKHIETLSNSILAVEQKIDYPKKEIEIIRNQSNSNGYEIDELISKMEKIVNDIHRLEEKIDADHRDLVDIRTRYINYREPIMPNSGVPWASRQKCKEDE